MKMDISNSNYALNKYFSEVVCISRAESDQVDNVVMSNVFRIIEYVRATDDRFGEPIHVGSAYQKLKVNKPDEFDLNIPLVGIARSDVKIEREHIFLGFSKGADPDAVTLRQDLKVIGVNRPLKSPGVQYFGIRLRSRQLQRTYSDMMSNGYLVPYLVKICLKELILEAISNLGLHGIVNLDSAPRGPAMTLKSTFWDPYNGGWETVKVDLAVVIPNVESFNDQTTDWVQDAERAQWPDEDKIDEITEMGIDAVAKKNFHWAFSFAECERAIVEKIDADGGVRKKVHRIMKSLWTEVTNNGETSKLNTYMLKNAWLLRCKKFSEDYEDWTPGRLAPRYYDCMEQLRRHLFQKYLPVYFCPAINLLQGISDENVQEMLDTINEMKQSFKEYKIDCNGQSY